MLTPSVPVIDRNARLRLTKRRRNFVNIFIFVIKSTEVLRFGRNSKINREISKHNLPSFHQIFCLLSLYTVFFTFVFNELCILNTIFAMLMLLSVLVNLGF